MKHLLRFFYKRQKYRKTRISVGGRVFSAIIADTFMKRMIGLMFRERLASNECMAIVFPDDGFWGIWMRNMSFPIDVAWVSAGGRVVSIKEDIKPCSSSLRCKTYMPVEKSRYVLEFNSGAIKKTRIKNGSKIRISL